MILRNRHWIEFIATNKAHQRELRALKELLYHYPALAKTLIKEHISQCLVSLLLGHCHNNTLTCSKTVIFKHRRHTRTSHIRLCILIVIKSLVCSRRNVILHHKLLSKLLARLNTSCALGMAKNLQPRSAESICHSRCQRGLRPNNSQVDTLLQSKSFKALNICILDSHALSHSSNTCIPWSAVDLLHLRRAAERINNGVLTTTRTYN